MGHKTGSLLKESLLPSLSTDGTISPKGFSRTHWNSLQCPAQWEMWKGYAGILMPLLPLLYHKPLFGDPTTQLHYSPTLGAVSSSVPWRPPSSTSLAPSTVFFSSPLPPASRSITYLQSGPSNSSISSALPTTSSSVPTSQVVPAKLQAMCSKLRCLNILPSSATLSPEPRTTWCSETLGEFESLWSQTSGMRKIS